MKAKVVVETAWEIIIGTLIMFAKMIIIMFAFFCMLQLITGHPPEYTTPMNYPMLDN
jgi:hypothetical protein